MNPITTAPEPEAPGQDAPGHDAPGHDAPGQDAPGHDAEAARLAALRACGALDTEAEDRYDDITRLAAALCGTPIAAVSLVDADRQFFKSVLGLGVRETPRDVSFCAHALLHPGDTLVVPDAARDPRFRDNALVTGDPGVRFYAGAPLVTEDGHALGALCVIDRVPRALTPDQEAALRVLARLATAQLEQARRLDAQARLIAERAAAEAERDRLAAIVACSDDHIISHDLDGRVTSWNGGAARTTGFTAAEVVGRHIAEMVPPERQGAVRAQVAADVARLRRGEVVPAAEVTGRRHDGTTQRLLLTVSPIRDAAGALTGFSSTARDVTAQRETEAALAREREFTAALVESLQEGIVACGPDGRHTVVNRATREFHGLPPAGPPPADPAAMQGDLYAADGLTPLPAEDLPLRRALAGETVRDAEMVIAPPDGPARTVLASGQAIHGAGGEKLGAVIALRDVTERRRAERELARLAAIVESSEEAILATTLDGTLVSWNAGAARLYGYAAAEVIGRHVSALAPEGERGLAREVIARLRAGEALAPMEVRRRRKDGAWSDVSLSFSPVRDAAGEMVGLSCIARDISDRRRAERALADSSARLLESEARLRLLTEAAFEGIAVSQDGRLVDANPAFAALFGCADAAAMVGLEAGALAAPESRARVLRHVADNDEAPYEATLLRPDGTTFEAEVRARRLQVGGRPARVTAVRDVTAQKALEAALRESRAFIQAVADQPTSLISVFDLDTLAHVYVNRGLAQFWGYGPAQARDLGAGLAARVVHPDDLARVQARLAEFGGKADGEVVEYEARCRHASGEWRWLWVRATVFQRHPDGTPRQIMATAQDVTDRKRAEDALRERTALLGGVLSTIPHQVFWKDADSVYQGCNENFARAAGLASPAEVVGRTDAQMPWTAAEAAAFVALDRQVMGGGRAVTNVEQPMRLADGTTMTGLTSKVPMRDAAGRVAGVLGIYHDITERKALEESLRRSESRLVRAQRVSQTGNWEYDPATGRGEWSGEMYRLMEFDPAEGPQPVDRILTRYLPADREVRARLFARALATGEPYQYEHRLALPSGALRWVRLVGQPQRDGAGRVHLVLGTVQDITAHKVLEEGLRAGQARLAEAQRVARMGSWELDVATGKIAWSDELFRLFGLDPAGEEPDLADALALYHSEDFPALEAAVARALETGAGYALDLRGAPRPGGQARWYHTVGTAATDPAGRVVRLAGTLADITERKRAEEALSASEAALRAVLESAPVILYAADAAGTVTLSEGTGLLALGLKPGEAVGRSVFEFTGGDPMAEDRTRRALAGEALSYDARAFGLSLHVELRPARGADGAPGGLIGVCFDVTERAASEERFRVLFEHSSDAHMLVADGPDGSGIIDCNPAAVAMLGCRDRAELLGLHPARLSPEFQPDGRRSAEAGPEMERLARAHGSHRFEWAHRRVDGAEFPAEITLTPVTLADRPVMLAVWHDLTERKRAEQAIRDYSVVLEYQKQQLEEANARLEDLATTDGLTGLKNHRAFQERLAEEVSRSGRYGPPLSLVLLDVDRFKQYNDTFGHPAGDDVLRRVARLLADGARTTDVVARYGGEEFVLLLPQTDAAGALVIAERLRAAVAGADWPARAVTVSLGVASLALGADSGRSLIARADAALYASKAAGRDRVTSAPPAHAPAPEAVA